MLVPRLSVFGMPLPIATNALALWVDPPYPGVEPCREGHRPGQKDSTTRQRLRNLALGAATRLVRTFPKCPIRLLLSDPERGVAAQIATGDPQSSRASLDPRYPVKDHRSIRRDRNELRVGWPEAAWHV